MRTYSVKQLAKLAGVSVRTLHHYDRLSLLKPSVRTEARYRLYGEKELIRLQQILFYKELDFPLMEIRQVLDDPDFDLVVALKSHKTALKDRRDRLTTLLSTIDKTISKLKGEQIMVTDEELYAGFPKETAESYRQEAVAKYGEKVVAESENKLQKLTKDELTQVKAEGEEIAGALAGLMHKDPTDPAVQQQVARHYAFIRKMWGPSVGNGDPLAAYRGLGQLYVDDPRYTSQNGVPNPDYARFLCKAMQHFVDGQRV
ncbi:MerR family transcriptional regulator [Larkinella terrae]|uniref:MerR family transcriptional regulator n=1 Tax=Larkinella terrae TaxID=2025311 RepID=A0A7K0ETT3_9BACT|nr:MerR family transcriptional regulator [Larkinella terrae]MRS64966.1 MerR family transcriptional regulator [Larkinella terrae]